MRRSEGWLRVACVAFACVVACSKKDAGRSGASTTGSAGGESSTLSSGGAGGTGGAGGLGGGGDAEGGGESVLGIELVDGAASEGGSVDSATEGAFDLGSQRAYVFGSFLGPGSNVVSRLTFPLLTKTPLPIAGLVDALDVRSMALSSAGERVAVAATPIGSGRPSVWLYSSDFLQGPAPLVESPSSSQRLDSLEFSPDGRWLAMLGDLEVVGAQSLYVVAVDGSSTEPRRVSRAPLGAEHDVVRFAWAKTSDETHARIAFIGDLEADGVNGVYAADIVEGSEAVPLLDTGSLGAGVGVDAAGLGWDSQERVYFRSKHEGTASPRIYRSMPDGTSLERYGASELTHGSGSARISSFALSPDGTSVAFTANAPSKQVYELYVASIDGDKASRISHFQVSPPKGGTRGPSTSADIAWSPNGKRLAVLADWEVSPGDPDDAFTAFVVSSNGLVGVRAIAPPPSAVLDLERVTFSRDSKRIYALGDLLHDGRAELFSAPAGGLGDVPPLDALAQGCATADGRVVGVVDAP